MLSFLIETTPGASVLHKFLFAPWDVPKLAWAQFESYLELAAVFRFFGFLSCATFAAVLPSFPTTAFAFVDEIIERNSFAVIGCGDLSGSTIRNGWCVGFALGIHAPQAAIKTVKIVILLAILSGTDDVFCFVSIVLACILAS